VTGRRIVSWNASKRGGHAQPPGPFAPGQRDSLGPGGQQEPSRPGQQEPSPAGPQPLVEPVPPAAFAPASQALSPPGPPLAPGEQSPSLPGASAPGAPGERDPLGGGERGVGPSVPPRRAAAGRRSPRHTSGGSARSGRKSSAASRQARRSKIAAAGIVVVGLLVIGLATGFGSEPSAEPTAQAFLLDWQQQQYRAAGSLTTASPDTVAEALRGAFAQLDATQLFLTMDTVAQHGDTADASFTASFSLAQSGRIWTYQGRFQLDRSGSGWRVVWTPSAVNPSLGPGERLAVVTQFPSRAPVLDDDGRPLEVPARVYVLGVWPGRLAHPQTTAHDFAVATGLETGQVLGQIDSAPPGQFLTLASLDPDTYANLRSRLQTVPGLVVQRTRERLFQAEATGLVGGVGNEVNRVLRADGAFYLPGTTVGLSGLEQAYQTELLGTPTTEVVAVNAAGMPAGVLARWPGSPGKSVHTTIDPKVQGAALAALDGTRDSGEIVAVQASTGQVLAVGQHQASGALPAGGPFDAKLLPGTAFTIVSAAALLHSGLTVSTPISCENSFTVGGQTFTSYGTGATKPFSAAFADDCGTAFAGLSERLDPGQFAQVVKGFGIGADWAQLPVPAFSGSAPAAADDAGLAAQTIGQGGVRVSLLSMAMVAAAVDSGAWRMPQLMPDPDDPARNQSTALNPAQLSALRSLMRGAVRSGAARAASLPGTPVYGQVSLVHTASGWMSWFVGFRGDVALAVIETGKTPQLSAAAVARAFLSALPS
jgi:cell division protein FtsI/penicillin-binding protein 2